MICSFRIQAITIDERILGWETKHARFRVAVLGEWCGATKFNDGRANGK